MENEIKKTWQETRFRQPTQQEIDSVISGERLTALQRLSKRYKRFSVIAAIFIFWSINLVFNPVFPKGSRFILGITFGIGFLICSVMDFYLYRKLQGINVATMNVREVINEALKLRKRHFQFMLFTIPWGIWMLGYIIYCCADNIYMMYGIAAGAVTGLLIGLYQLSEFMADYKRITEPLN